MKRMCNGMVMKLTVCLVAVVLITAMMLTDAWQAEAATSLKNPIVKDKGDGGNLVAWDCVYFGYYPQSEDGQGGFLWEPIKWRVLSVEDNEALLLADKNLDVLPYHEAEMEVFWERSTLRSWLNGYDNRYNACNKDFTEDNFLDIAFTSAEQKAIKISTRRNADNSPFGTDGGNPTEDRAFLLSIEDATNLSYGFHEDRMHYDDAREAKNSEYVASMPGMSGKDCVDFWWLSSPGNSACFAAFVQENGYLDAAGNMVNGNRIAVRPALRIDLSSNLWRYAGIVCSDGTEAAYIGEKTVKLSKTSYTYSGSDCKPSVTINGLESGKDYIVTYKNNRSPGTATVIVTGTGKYTGTITKNFTIALPAPKNLKLTTIASSGYPKLTWNKVNGASKYEVWRKSGSGGTYAKQYTTTGTSYTNSSAKPGTVYYYKVKAICGTNSKGNSSFSGVKSIACDLAQPKGLKVTTVASSGKPKVSWNKVTDATKYEVWRKIGSNGTYVKQYTTTGTSYTNTSSTAGKVYYYKVKAICGKNSGGNSAFSTSDYVTCDLARPKITVSGTKKPGRIVISWNKVANADRYYIYRATSKNGTYSKYASTTGTTYTNSSVTEGKYYYYKVKAVCDDRAAANSAYSNMDYAWVR